MKLGRISGKDSCSEPDYYMECLMRKNLLINRTVGNEFWRVISANQPHHFLRSYRPSWTRQKSSALSSQTPSRPVAKFSASKPRVHPQLLLLIFLGWRGREHSRINEIKPVSPLCVLWNIRCFSTCFSKLKGSICPLLVGSKVCNTPMFKEKLLNH